MFCIELDVIYDDDMETLSVTVNGLLTNYVYNSRILKNTSNCVDKFVTRDVIDYVRANYETQPIENHMETEDIKTVQFINIMFYNNCFKINLAPKTDTKLTIEISDVILGLIDLLSTNIDFYLANRYAFEGDLRQMINLKKLKEKYPERFV